MPSFFSSRIMTVILAGLCLWFLFLAVGGHIRRIAAQRELGAVSQRIEDGQRENARLAQELERMQQPTWLALLARTRLNYKRPDETVVFVYKSEKPGTISQPQPVRDERPSWRRWWDWVQGK
jgi:cell division protein FtsB